MKYNPWPYQQHATQHLMDHPCAGLFLDMGLGKTVSTLTAIVQLMQQRKVFKVLVIAPKRVAEDTWSTEAGKWDHTQHLSISKVLGSAKERKEALRRKADIYVVNRENVPWLIAEYQGAFPFDMLVIDELSSFKNGQSKRFKALRMVRPKVSRVVGLTGTPTPNGLVDLWPQMYLLDMGERLGKTLTGYRDRYFTPAKKNGHVVYSYKFKAADDLLGADYYEKEIYDKIGDICISMKAADYLNLPERVDVQVAVRLEPEALKQYKQFERDQVLQLAEAGEISAANAAALTTKLLQYGNGAIYDDDKNWHEVHGAKLDALDEIVDTAQGPVLIFYQFKHDLERIKSRLKGYQPRELNTSADIADWNAGKVPVLLAHPASAGHGLNLQAGGNIIVWFGLPWSLELFQQANARLHRQGQQHGVIIHMLITEGTMDPDVLQALTNKSKTQDALLAAVKARIAHYMNQMAAA